MATIVAVGVDNGGTWIRLKGLDAKGRSLWSLKKPSPSVDDLPRFLKKSLKPFRGKLPALAIGSRGVWKKSKRQALQRAMQGLAKTIVVMSDVEAAWLAAFSPHPRFARPLPTNAGRGQGSAFSRGNAGEGGRRPDEGEGILVISGTGSIAYGKRSDGTFARAGGLGPKKSDEGSGHWIAKEWLRRIPSPQCGRGRSEAAGEGVNAVRKIASLAPMIIRKAKNKNPLAAGLIREAQNHLASLVLQLTGKLSWKGNVPLSVSGSVLENEWFKQGFFRALRTKGIHFHFVHKKIDPAIAPLTQVARCLATALSHKGRGE